MTTTATTVPSQRRQTRPVQLTRAELNRIFIADNSAENHGLERKRLNLLDNYGAYKDAAQLGAKLLNVFVTPVPIDLLSAYEKNHIRTALEKIAQIMSRYEAKIELQLQAATPASTHAGRSAAQAAKKKLRADRDRAYSAAHKGSNPAPPKFGNGNNKNKKK